VPIRAIGMPPAISIACAMSRASMRMKPAICSLASEKGPSVIDI
jgi:hypothetical protein